MQVSIIWLYCMSGCGTWLFCRGMLITSIHNRYQCWPNENTMLYVHIVCIILILFSSALGTNFCKLSIFAVPLRRYIYLHAHSLIDSLEIGEFLSSPKVQLSLSRSELTMTPCSLSLVNTFFMYYFIMVCKMSSLGTPSGFGLGL